MRSAPSWRRGGIIVAKVIHVARGATWDRNMSEAGSSRGEIFVVDDDPAVRGTLSVILCRDGYEVVCFAEGASFLGAARAREPACVLLDVYLPGRSGLDILKELNAEEYDLGQGRHTHGGRSHQEWR